MADVIGEAFVDVKPRTDHFASDTEKGVSSGLGSVAKKVAIGFGAVLATGAAVHFVGGFVKAAAESQKISRVTDAILKSTGNAAQLSADQVGQLATRLSNLTGIDDELIQSSSNILLTFTNIKDAAGAGNDIFSRATESALNMATVLGGDPTSAIQQLGKALNDPSEGLTKLAKSGVVFTDQQKEMVKQLQASGDVLGAQKVILDELDKEFGGAAAAAADPFDRLTVVMGNLKEAIGGALIPVLAPAATAIANLISEHTADIAGVLQGALNGLAGVINFLKPGVENVAEAFGFLYDKLAPLADRIGEFIDDHLPKLSGALEQNTPLMEALSTAVVILAGALVTAGAASAALGPVIPAVQVLGALGGSFGGIASAAAAAAGPIAAIALPLLAAAAAGEALYQIITPVKDAFDSLFGETIAPFAAALTFLNPFVPLAVGAKFLYDRIAPLRAAVDGIVGVFSNLGSAVGDAVGGINLSGLGEALSGALSGALGAVDLSTVGEALASALSGALAAVSTASEAIRGAIAPAVGFLIGLWEQYGDEVSTILAGFRDIAVAVFGNVARILEVFAGQLANVASVARELIGPAFEFISATVEIAFAPLATIISGALSAASTAFETFIGVIGPAWETLWGLVTDVVANVIDPIRSIIEGFLGIIAGFVDVVAGILTLDWSRAWEGISGIVSGALEIVQGLLETMLGFLSAVWNNAAALLTLPFTTAWAVIQGVVEIGVTTVTTLLQGALDFVSAVWSNIGTLLSAPVEAGRVLITGILSGIVLLFSALPGQITGALASFGSAIIGVITGATAGIVGAAATLISSVVTTIGELPGKAATAIATLGSSLAGAIASAAISAVSAAGSLVSDVVSKISELPGKAAGVLAGVGAGIASGIKDAVKGALNTVIDAFNNLSDIDTPFGTIGLPDIPRLALGGIVPGGAGDAVPAILHGGEVVLNAGQQANLLFNLSRARLTPDSNGSGPVYIDARMIVETGAAILGLDDLEARFDQQADRLADIVSSGRR